MENQARTENDRDLAQRALRGEEGAFSRLVRENHPNVFRLVRGILGDWHWSEDVCQDVFTTVYRKLGSFRGQSRLSTWIFRIAVHAALKARARKRRRQAETADILEDLAAGSSSGAPELEGSEVFEKLLRPLPEKLRTVVVLRDQLGLNYEEIAKVLGCSRGAVEQRLHRAMVALREVWRREDWLER